MKPRIKETIEFTALPENKNTVQGNSKNVRLQNATHKITATISKYLSILYIIFLYINITITRKMRALRKKNEKKVHKKTSTQADWLMQRRK